MSRALPLIAAAFLAACEGGVTEPDPTAPRSVVLAVVRGDGQIGRPGRLLGQFLVFRVTDATGGPVVGLPVEWEVVAGGGKVSGKRHQTDLEGLAAGNFTLGDEPGEHVARAVVHDSLTIEFTAIAIEQDPEPSLP
ncbi:MAG TPA: hypothetical protein VM778_09930 [Gemmatimonadota bacterium]|nr:hypothetical protein [Gemmatimonadota bacterium]